MFLPERNSASHERGSDEEEVEFQLKWTLDDESERGDTDTIV